MMSSGGRWDSLAMSRAFALSAAAALALACGGNQEGRGAGVTGGAGGTPGAAGGAGFQLTMGGSGGALVASGPVTEGDLSSRSAAAVCDNIASCCGNAGVTFDTAQCALGLESDYKATYASYLGVAVTFDAAAALDCITQTATAARACSFVEPDEIDACNQIFLPTLAAGAACKNGLECAPRGGAFCDSTATPPVCKLASNSDPFAGEPRGKAGDACNGSCKQDQNGTLCGGQVATQPAAAVCWANDGFYCGPSGVCSAAKAAGETCGSNPECGPLLYCDLSGTHLCVAQSDTGPCSPGGIECSSKSFCDSPSAHCQLKQADGKSCTGDLACTGGRCSAHTHTCTTRLAELCRGYLY